MIDDDDICRRLLCAFLASCCPHYSNFISSFINCFLLALQQVLSDNAGCRHCGTDGSSCTSGSDLSAVVEGLVVDICDDEAGSLEGLLTGRLDLLLGEEVAELACVPQLKGVGERDPYQTSPVSRGTRVSIYRPRDEGMSDKVCFGCLEEFCINSKSLFVCLITIDIRDYVSVEPTG